jgi:hypothetical protein
VTVLADGNMVEVATIGREGVVGAAAGLDGHAAVGLSMVQGETDICYRCQPRRFDRSSLAATPFAQSWEHGLEFWTGLLGYVLYPLDPCVKHERVCTCRSCEDLCASGRRVRAIAAAGPSPRDRGSFSLCLDRTPGRAQVLREPVCARKRAAVQTLRHRSESGECV